MKFSMGVLVSGFEYAVFDGVVHGSRVWFSSFGSYYGYFGEVRVEVEVVMVGVLGGVHG